MNICGTCGRGHEAHCPKCQACSITHRCDPPRQESYAIVHPSSGQAVTGERRP